MISSVVKIAEVLHVYSWILFPRVSGLSIRFVSIWFYLSLCIYWIVCLFLCLVVFLIHVHVHKALHGMISSCPHGWDWNPGTFHSNSLKLTEGWGEMNMFHFGSLAHCYVPVCFFSREAALASWPCKMMPREPRPSSLVSVSPKQDERGGSVNVWCWRWKKVLRWSIWEIRKTYDLRTKLDQVDNSLPGPTAPRVSVVFYVTKNAWSSWSIMKWFLASIPLGKAWFRT